MTRAPSRGRAGHRSPEESDRLWERIVETKRTTRAPLREIAKLLKASPGSVMGLWYRRGPASPPRSPATPKSKD